MCGGHGRISPNQPVASIIQQIPTSAKFPRRFADRVIVTRERLEDRELCADLVKVIWDNDSGSRHEEWAILSDISPSGACLEAEEPVPPDTVVSLQLAGDQCQARVKYCKFDKVNFLLGIQFLNGYRWSRRRFKPEHLTQFRLFKVKKTG